MHCHIFKHSDGGMLMITNVTAPAEPQQEVLGAAIAPRTAAPAATPDALGAAPSMVIVAASVAVLGAVLARKRHASRRREPERQLLVQHDASLSRNAAPTFSSK